MGNAVLMARWRAEQRAKGRCIECTNPTEGGKLRCTIHLAGSVKSVQRARDKKKEKSA